MIQLGKKAIITAVSTLVLFGAVIAGVAIAEGEEFDPIHAPDWKAGYSFSYDATADVQMVTDGNVADEFGIPGQGNLSLGPFPVKKEILSTQYEDADGYPVYVSAATFPFSNLQTGVPIFDQFVGQQAFVSAERQNDLAPVPLVPDMSCASDTCAGGGLKFLDGNDMTYLNFPLSPEKRWEQTINMPMTFLPEELQGIDRMHVVGEVTGKESVDLGSFGEVDAVRVDFSYTPVGLQQIVSEFAQGLEDLGLEIERFNFQVGLHEIVYYADELQAIVSQEYILYTFVDIAANGEVYGHEVDHEIFAEVTARVKLVLTGANTEVEGKERTPLEILEIVGDPGLIADARGQGVGASPYTISLTPSRNVVNAAEKPLVTFSVGVQGVDKLPEGSSTSYEVRDAKGKALKVYDAYKGQADAFGLTMDAPGVYDVTAKVTGPDGGVKVASARVIANWEEEVQAQCGISLLGSYCQPHEFPVKPGVQDLQISVVPDQMMPVILGETMIIDYANGNTEAFYNEYEASYGAEALEHGAGLWAVSYEAEGAYFSGATYVISSTYAAPSAATVVAAQEPEPEASSDPSGPMGFMGAALQGIDQVLADL